METYKAVNPDVEIVVCTNPDVRSVNTMDIPSDVISEYIYPLQLEIAAELGAKVVDFHALIDGKSEAHKNLLYLDDGIHLTRDAAIELAGLIKKTV